MQEFGESKKDCRDDAAEEIVLSESKSVTRRDDVVLRPAGPWTPAVHALLRHLASAGFRGAPAVVGAGVDGGRETVRYVEGEFVHPGPWSGEALYEVGRMLRSLHDASATFEPPPGAVWKPWFLRELGGTKLVYGHGDVAPWNMVTRGGMPVALVDWEFAGPIDPAIELARTCWLFPQLHDDDVAAMVGLPPLEERARQLRALVDGYGADRETRLGLFDRMIEVAVSETAEEAIEAGVGPETEGPLWGLAWRARAAAWMLRHRAALERALA